MLHSMIVSFTHQYESHLTYSLKSIISQSTADYAVVTGVQIHNWATDFDGGAPSLEFVAPTKMYIVVNGVKVHLDLTKVPVSGFVVHQTNSVSLEVDKFFSEQILFLLLTVPFASSTSPPVVIITWWLKPIIYECQV